MGISKHTGLLDFKPISPSQSCTRNTKAHLLKADQASFDCLTLYIIM